jgi:hypothetical protein
MQMETKSTSALDVTEELRRLWADFAHLVLELIHAQRPLNNLARTCFL